MKFHKKYPDVKDQDEFSFEGDVIVFFKEDDGPCMACKETTHFASLSFEAYFCSEECNHKMWKEYFEACKKAEARECDGIA